MNYTIHQLNVFLKVVETSSITKAAEELYMTQPAVSIQLKNFQDQFSIPLTEIVGRKLFVTEFGHEIALVAKNAIEELSLIQFKTKEYEGALRGKLKISSASTGKYVMPFFLSGFLKEHSGIDMVLDVTNKTRVIESLKKNEIDFALVSIIPDGIEFEEEKLVENKLFLVGDQPDFEEDKALIFREEGSATRLEMENYFAKHEQNKRKRLELTSNEAVKQAIIAGVGYSILPIIGLKNSITNGELHVIQRKGLPLKTEWRLIWLKGKKLSPVAQSYLNFVRSNKQDIVKHHFGWYLNYQ